MMSHATQAKQSQHKGFNPGVMLAISLAIIVGKAEGLVSDGRPDMARNVPTLAGISFGDGSKPK